MKSIRIFENAAFGQIRTLTMADGQVGFVGKDVAEALGYSKPRNAIAMHVDEEDKTTALIQGPGSNYKTQVTIINESGLYALMLQSKLPHARDFKRWVTSVVLPMVRRTGGYIPVGEEDDEKSILAKTVEILKKTLKARQQIIKAQSEQIGRMRPKAKYAEDVLLSPTCYTMTQVAKSLSMTVHELQRRLHELKVIYRSPSGPFMLYAGFLKQGYEAYRTRKGDTCLGKTAWTDTYLVWTESGKEFIHSLINDKAA